MTVTNLTYDEFRTLWRSMTERQQARVQDKARWEHMGVWAVLNEWPKLRQPDRAAASGSRSEEE